MGRARQAGGRRPARIARLSRSDGLKRSRPGRSRNGFRTAAPNRSRRSHCGQLPVGNTTQKSSFLGRIGAPEGRPTAFTTARVRPKWCPLCAVIFTEFDSARSDALLDPGITLEQVRVLYDAVTKNRRDGDDITRSLWFHLNGFSGEADELAKVERTLRDLHQIERAETIRLPFWNGDPVHYAARLDARETSKAKQSPGPASHPSADANGGRQVQRSCAAGRRRS